MVNIEKIDDASIAKAIYEFFRYQLERAIEVDINCRSHQNAALLANKEAIEAKESSGFSVRIPHNEESLRTLEKNVNDAIKQRNVAKLCLDFVVNKLIDKSMLESNEVS